MNNAGLMKDNERSWGIDLISQINTYALVREKESIIQYAGGEMSLAKSSGSLFPDIMLFADRAKTQVLHGWELKYPNTDINDREFYDNARQKAELLGVNSFVLWNASIARLFVKNENSEKYSMLKEWDELSYIKTRADVAYHMGEIQNLLTTILEDLNYFFNNGVLKTERVISSVSGEYITEFILKNVQECAKSLKKGALSDADFNDQVILWWEAEKEAYGKKGDKWIEMSKLAIISLMNKIIFANILKKYYADAKLIDTLIESIGIEECLNLFKDITDKCDFYNIFEEKPGEKYIDGVTLNMLIDFNKYLVDLDFTNYDDKLLGTLLSQIVTRSKRKVAGQFSTPKELAMFLVAMTMKNKMGNVVDPCCGTGTIVKSAYDLKVNAGITPSEALKQVWAGDKFRYPLQFAMLALTSPQNMGQQINIYKEDVFNVNPGQKIQIHSSSVNTVEEIDYQLFDTIVSNLPFVQQETLQELNASAIQFINTVNEKFNGRSDLYTYITLKIEQLLKIGGRAGVIISNSWLGTEFGDKFFDELTHRYNIEYIITSGKGRWFKNADVVTNILILSKSQNISNQEIKFVVIQDDLRSIVSDENNVVQVDKVESIVAKIRSNMHSDLFSIYKYSHQEIKELQETGIVKNALFANASWLLSIKDKLQPLTKFFEVKRGERRGWNDLFYPQNHNIDKEYLVPVMKKLDTSSYLMNLGASIEGFCCNKSIEELKALGHKNTVEWIEQFQNITNGTGILLPKALAKKGVYWYEMPLNKTFEVGLLINPDERLFFSKAPYPVFFDQRLTGLKRKSKKYNLDVLMALMNSIVGLYFIEAIGFGRGLGVLDLNKNKVEKNFKILNPDYITENGQKTIMDLYKKIEIRDVRPLLEELQMKDREEFDKAVLQEFGIEEYYDVIKESLIQIFKIRKAVNTTIGR